MSTLVAVLILIPLAYHQNISMSGFRSVIFAPQIPRVASPPDLPTGAISIAAVQFDPGTLVEPPSIPTHTADSPVEPQPPGIFIIGSMSGEVSYPMAIFDSPGGFQTVAPPPTSSADQPAPPDAPEQSDPMIRIRVGGNVQAARLIAQPRTPYPPLARQMRVQGTVRLEALINMDGTVEDVRVLSGHPLLVQAALDSVRQWRYEPTLLNGEPVGVITTIELNFTLAQ
jgi:protein TonB